MFLGPWMPQVPRQSGDAQESLKGRSAATSAVLFHSQNAPLEGVFATVPVVAAGEDPGSPGV